MELNDQSVESRSIGVHSKNLVYVLTQEEIYNLRGMCCLKKKGYGTYQLASEMIANSNKKSSKAK